MYAAPSLTSNVYSFQTGTLSMPTPLMPQGGSTYPTPTLTGNMNPF